MTTEQWIAASSGAAVIVSAIAIIVSMTHVRDQFRTQIFLVYTERYAKTMGRLPFQARHPGSSYRLSDIPDGERADVLAAFRDYFNMCAEEMWLKSTGRIDSGTWKVWHAGMKEVARFPSFTEAWQELADEYHYFTKFRSFMDAVIADVAVEHASRSAAAAPPMPGPKYGDKASETAARPDRK
jgi:hypothetical protein